MIMCNVNILYNNNPIIQCNHDEYRNNSKPLNIVYSEQVTCTPLLENYNRTYNCTDISNVT